MRELNERGSIIIFVCFLCLLVSATYLFLAEHTKREWDMSRMLLKHQRIAIHGNYYVKSQFGQEEVWLSQYPSGMWTVQNKKIRYSVKVERRSTMYVWSYTGRDAFIQYTNYITRKR